VNQLATGLGGLNSEERKHHNNELNLGYTIFHAARSLLSFSPLAWSCLRESFLGKRLQHGRPGSNPVQEGHEPWPSAHIELVNFRPIQDRIGISISDSKCLTREIGLIPELAIQYVKSLRQILYRCLAPFGRWWDAKEVQSLCATR